MTKMIHWFDEEQELNVVLYPQDNTALRKLQQKLLRYFPFARSLEDYPFPAMLCHKSIAQVSELDVRKTLPGTCLCRFRAKNLIVENNHLLVEYLPVTQEDAAALERLLSKVGPGESGHLIMPIAWLPKDQLFSCQLLERIEIFLNEIPSEITVDLCCPESYLMWDWYREWGDAFGIPDLSSPQYPDAISPIVD